jgi:hypothetical protein
VDLLDEPTLAICFTLNAENRMDVMSLLIQLISGAVGGNVGGLLNKAKSLGPLINTVLGALSVAWWDFGQRLRQCPGGQRW